MRLKHKSWVTPYLIDNQHAIYDCQTISQLINQSSEPIILEIGTGKGQFIIDMAQKYPNKIFVGLEKEKIIYAMALRKKLEANLANIHLALIDVSSLFDQIEPKRVATVFLNFSDPWPKKRHHKRRLTSMPFLQFYEHILIDQGQIIFKTDNEQLYLYSLRLLEKTRYNIIVNQTNYDGQDDFDSQTEYEQNFRQLNHPIYKIIARKG